MSRPSALARVVLGASLALGLTGLQASPADAAGPEQIVNGGFDNGLVGWNAYPNPQVVDGGGCVDVAAGSGAYGAGMLQNVPLMAGETYQLTFEALTSPATTSNVRLIVQGGPDVNYKQFLPAQRLALDPAGQQFSYTFTPDADYASAELGLQQDVANDTAYRLCVDNVSLTGGAEPEPYVPDTGPAVRVNQVGYRPTGPKVATVVTDATRPLPWKLLDANGAVQATGRTHREGVDPSAGVTVHTADFSRVRTTGTGYTLVVGDQTSYPFSISASVLGDLRVDSKTLFYTQRSGIAIDDSLVPGYGREAGHLGKAPNTGDTAVGCQSLTDSSQLLLDQPWTCEGVHDVHGGWYDAGDHGKYVVNAGISVAQLMMEYERNPRAYSDGQLAIPEAGNGVPDLLDEVRWELEWMLRMQVADGEQYAGMAYHKVADADWTGLPLMPSDDPQTRVLYRPSTAATLNLAAAAAQGSRLFADVDATFASQLLAASERAYAAALATPNLFAPAPNPSVDPNPGSGPYDDDEVSDEFYWAAAELYLTTGSHNYLDAVVASPLHTSDVFAESFDWGHVAALGRLDLATVDSALPDRKRVQKSVIKGADRYLAFTRQPFGQAYGETEYSWGSNSAILSNLQVIGTAHDLTGRAKYAEGVLGSLDYLFGRNALNISYVTGYGTVYSQNQHSRWYSHQLDSRLPNPPKGTVAGGANSTAPASGDPVAGALLAGCVHQFCYVDDIGSWSTNELTINWNSALSWVGGFVADLGPKV